jgi:hypothetical protein
MLQDIRLINTELQENLITIQKELDDTKQLCNTTLWCHSNYTETAIDLQNGKENAELLKQQVGYNSVLVLVKLFLISAQKYVIMH